MDAKQFDSLTRSLYSWSTRRRLVAGLIGGLLASPLLGGAADVAARRCPPCRRRKEGRCRKKRRNGTPCGVGKTCQRGRCVCPAGTTECSGVCVDTTSDPRNCGTCGTRCQLNGACLAGRCDCVPVGCGALVGACCPGPGGGCGCASSGFIDPRTCTNVLTCPSDTTPCVGTCRTCCPAGTTCDPSTGTCLQQ